MCPFWKILASTGICEDREGGGQGVQGHPGGGVGLGRDTGDPLYLVSVPLSLLGMVWEWDAGKDAFECVDRGMDRLGCGVGGEPGAKALHPGGAGHGTDKSAGTFSSVPTPSARCPGRVSATPAATPRGALPARLLRRRGL